MDVDGAYPHVWAERIFVEEDAMASNVVNVEAVREGFVLQIRNSFLQSNDVPFPCNMTFDGTGVPRLGPGFQVKMLMRVCSCCWCGLLVSNLYSDGKERHVLWKASRNTGSALPLLVMWRVRIVVGSAVTHGE